MMISLQTDVSISASELSRNFIMKGTGTLTQILLNGNGYSGQNEMQTFPPLDTAKKV